MRFKDRFNLERECDMSEDGLTPELEAFIDAYVEANIDERVDADEPCEHFVDGFVAACKPEDFDELDDEEREAIVEEALDRLGDYRVSLIVDDLIEEAIELYEEEGDEEDGAELLPEGLIENET